VPSEAYLDDLVEVVRALNRVDDARALATHEFEGEPPNALSIDLHVFSDEFHDAVNVQQGLLLSLEAAAVFVEVVAQDLPLTRDALLRIAGDLPVEITVVAFMDGSWGVLLRLDPRTKAGRSKLLAIGGIATAAAAMVFPPVGIVALSAAVASGVNEFLPDKTLTSKTVPLRTIDQTRVPEFNAEIAAELTTQRDDRSERESTPATTQPKDPSNAEPTPRAPGRSVYHVVVDGTDEALQALLASVRSLNSAAAESRFIPKLRDVHERRIRVVSSTPLTADQLNQLASDAGAKIIAIRTIEGPPIESE
jgi:hypothetical protein